MSETTEAVAGHAPNLFARWIVDNFPRFQVSCECGWKTAAEDSEQAATDSHAEHARQPIGSPTWNPMRQAFDRPPSLAEFLLARIAEDKVGAREGMERRRAEALATASAFGVSYVTVGGPFDPARVLADLAAKRQIVERAYELIPHVVVEDCWYTCPAATEDRDGGECCDDARRDAGCDCGSDMRVGLLLKLLAAPYADHPDYREDWRP